MDVDTQLKLCLHEQTYVVPNAVLSMGSLQFQLYVCSLNFCGNPYCNILVVNLTCSAVTLRAVTFRALLSYRVVLYAYHQEYQAY